MEISLSVIQNDSSGYEVTTTIPNIRNANEVIAYFSIETITRRLGYIHVINVGGVGYAFNNTITTKGFTASCQTKIDFSNGNFYFGCGTNTWGFSQFPMKISANSIIYR